ncbi:unnamed protein product [Euphydryas editha]|uniref:Uncharacterized protein n=1 Tax=Euphydryas editha TaxID=104508 RepID=A0AAU9TIJ0_EUPED|nr:unnamed protein product [Euphydryas editha]
MKESYYPNDIMLCFVQGFGDREPGYGNHHEGADCDAGNINNLKKKPKRKSVTVGKTSNSGVVQQNDVKLRRTESFVAEKSVKETFHQGLPDVKRSFSDRFSVITDANGRKPPKGLLTIRKTW